MSKKTNTVESGVPRPYSRRILPTPKNVLKESVSPFKLWQVLILGFIALSVLVFTLYNAGYAMTGTFIEVSILVVAISISLSILDRNSEDSVQEIPSISDVSNTIEYVRAASRLSVLTIIGTLLTIGLLLISHTSDAFYYIDDSTRLIVIALLGIAFLFSYLIVKSLCSYSSIYNSTILSTPVNVSSIPEIFMVIGFIISPILFISTGLIYNGPVILSLPFDVTLIDTIVILSGMLYLYISGVSRV